MSCLRDRIPLLPTPRRRRWAGAGVLAGLAVLGACAPTTGTPSNTSTGGASAASSARDTTTAAAGSSTTGAGPSGAGSSSSAASSSNSASSSAAHSCAAGLADGLSARRKAGQLLMVALTPDAGLGVVTQQVAGGSVGGVIYLGGWSAGQATIAATSRQLQDAAEGEVGLFVAADQEGGQIQQLTGPGFATIPSATQQGTLAPAALTAATADWARELATAGVNVDLAPVADTVPADIGTANGPIGAYHREFGSTPDAVAPAVEAVIAGLHQGGVAAAVKHFPGIGRIRGNTDTAAGGITDSIATQDDPHLRPFAAGMGAGADFVMVSTARYPRIDPDNQAIFSRAIVTELLRGRLGWGGVVITDDVGAAQSVAAVPVGDRATRFVAAGGDIVLTARGSDIAPMQRALVDRAESDPAFAEQLDAAVLRVLTLKTARGLTSCPKPG